MTLRGVTLTVTATLVYTVDDAATDAEAIAKARRELARVVGVDQADTATVNSVEPSDAEIKLERIRGHR